MPLWSLALMLLLVVSAIAGIALIIFSLGGNTPLESAPIILVVNSPAPTEHPGVFPPSSASATIPPYAHVIMNRPPVTFALSGPTLAPPQVTPTPRRIAIGETVIVADVGTQQLNVRDNAGVMGSVVIFRAEERSVFTVVDGPQQVDGLTWWKVQDPHDPNRAGWAASNYLTIALDQ